MAIVIILAYVGILFGLVKIGLIKWTPFWKASPVVLLIVLIFVLFIPMQFYAPSGQARVVQDTVAITPNVSGPVTEVVVRTNQSVSKGDVLFQIDPTIFKATRDQLQAQVQLARIRLEQTQELRADDAVSAYELQEYEAQVKQLEASLSAAEWNLKESTVRAPVDGTVTNLSLRPGARVGGAPVLVIVEDTDHIVAAQIPQGYLRHVAPGQKAELTFKIFPGYIFTAEVDYIVKAIPTGQVQPSGTLVAPQKEQALPYYVRLKLDDTELLNSLPPGAVGTAAILTQSGAPTHIVRRVMLRMEAWQNFLNPML